MIPTAELNRQNHLWCGLVTFRGMLTVDAGEREPGPGLGDTMSARGHCIALAMPLHARQLIWGGYNDRCYRVRWKSSR